MRASSDDQISSHGLPAAEHAAPPEAERAVRPSSSNLAYLAAERSLKAADQAEKLVDGIPRDAAGQDARVAAYLAVSDAYRALVETLAGHQHTIQPQRGPDEPPSWGRAAAPRAAG